MLQYRYTEESTFVQKIRKLEELMNELGLTIMYGHNGIEIVDYSGTKDVAAIYIDSDSGEAEYYFPSDMETHFRVPE